MPLNRTNTRQAFRTVYAGISEYVYLQRRGSDGKMTSIRELWKGLALPSKQTNNGELSPVNRPWKLFRRPGDKWKPPKPGDRIVRKLDGTEWDIPPEAVIKRDMFGNSVYETDTVQLIPPEGNA